MFNPNDMRNMWPSITPLIPQQLNQTQFGLYNNQTLNHSSFPQQIPINTSVLLPNQQNMDQMMRFYNQNQVFAQHLTPFINSYNCFQPSLEQQMTQTNSFFTQTISQPNLGFNANISLQTYPPMTQKQIQTLVSPQMQINSNQTMNNTNDKMWLNLLNPSQKSVLEVLNKEQEEFELQFNNWEKEFNNWKEANRSHPDKNAYYSYVTQWQEWRKKLVSRKQQMKELHNKTMDQLYSQLHQTFQPNAMPNAPPLPPESRTQPPLPPTVICAPPPPPPPPPPESQFSRSIDKTLFNSNQILQKNGDNDSDNQQKNSITSNAIDEKYLNQSNLNSVKSREINSSEAMNKTIETNFESEKDCDSSTVVSKAAETILFIQKQQDLLKSLDSFKKANQFSGDVEIIDGPKPFNINDIVTKMKVIRPPENPNQIFSSLDFNQNSASNVENNFDVNREQYINTINQSFDRTTQEPYQRYQNNYNNPIQVPDHRMQRIRPHRLPIHTNPNAFQRPQSHNSNDRQFLPFDSVRSNRWVDSRSNIPREREYFHGVNDKNSQNFNRNDNELPQQSSNMAKKYSAQTIDYNHRPENRNYDSRDESQYSRPSAEHLSHNFDNKVQNNFNIQSSHSSHNNYNSRKSFNSPEKTIPVIEEKLSFRDLRYFTEPPNRVVLIDDLLKPPSREFRPQNIVIILRGLPGSGKTHFAKMVKEKEVGFGGSAPRILSIDDYFMAEIERQIKDTETGKLIQLKEYVYEYESEMESCYRTSLLKSFKRTIDDRLFPFIIIDAVNELIGYIEEFYSYAIKNGFAIYVTEMDCSEPSVCHKNNIHKRKLEDIKLIHKKWEILPDFMLRLDIQSFLQNDSIEDVEMDSNNSKISETVKRKAELESDSSKKQVTSSLSSDSSKLKDISDTHSSLSRWERMESSEEKLDKLDSFKMKTKLTIEEYLQVTEDYEQRQGQKRVRWADIEESKKQAHMRKIGFVVGVDWQQFMDPQHCERALTKTKYF